MSVGSIITGGVGLVRTRPRLIAAWTVIYLVVATLSMVAMRPVATAMIAFQQEVLARQAAGIATPPPFPADGFGILFLLEFAFVILGIVAFAAVVRAVTRPGEDRLLYLRLGMDELRLLALGVIVVVAAIAAEVVAILAVALVAIVAKLALGDAAAISVGVLVGIMLLAAAIYVEVRLSLVGALTVMCRRIVIVDAWRATRGRFWMLVGVYVLLGVAFMGVGLVMMVVTSPALLMAYARMDQPAMMAAAQAQMAWQAGPSVGFVVQMVVGSIVTVVFGVVSIGSVATAALELGGRKPAVLAEDAPPPQ